MRADMTMNEISTAIGFSIVLMLPAAAAEIKFIGPDIISVSGRIEAGDHRTISRIVLAKMRDSTTIILNSGGGFGQAAFMIGRAIRNRVSKQPGPFRVGNLQGAFRGSAPTSAVDRNPPGDPITSVDGGTIDWPVAAIVADVRSAIVRTKASSVSGSVRVTDQGGRRIDSKNPAPAVRREAEEDWR
jgi:hypothetical protein